MAQQQKLRNDNIKVLSVVWYKVLPPKFGGQKAVAVFNEHLGRLLSLICICSKNNNLAQTSYVIHNKLPVSKTQFLNPFTWRQIYITAKIEKVTHLIIEFPYHGIAGFICKKLLGIKLITNTHNIEFIRAKEGGKWWWGPLYHLEKWTVKHSDLVFFKTDEDNHIAQKHFGLSSFQAATIPYGAEKKIVDKKEAQSIIRSRHQIGEQQKIFLFAGTLDYAPNAVAVVAIKERIIPLLNETGLKYKILVCGRNKYKEFQYLNSLKDENLVLAGEVDDIETYFSAADVFINPVSGGGGVQTKIMDALSYDLNVVCFATKDAGIKNAGNKIFTANADDWNGFVSSVTEAANKSEETPQSFFETYNWRTIAANAFQKISAI